MKRSWGFVTLFAFLAALAIPVFAHGCHAGDHDEEPAAAPIERGEHEVCRGAVSTLLSQSLHRARDAYQA